jgi:purine-binding chemotaxis protein CheW
MSAPATTRGSSGQATPSLYTAPGSEYLSFRLGTEEYGIPILTVQEIRGYTEPTRIASQASHNLGVLNLRGVIVPIVDLRIKLAQAEVTYNDVTVTIVLNLGERVVGVVVDAVQDVIALKPDDIKPAPAFQTGVDERYITGIATLRQDGQERLLILMAIDRVFASQDASDVCF